MIQMGTILEVADNSGARKIACIRMRGGSAGQYAGLGDIITASVKEAAPDSPFVKKTASAWSGRSSSARGATTAARTAPTSASTTTPRC